MLAKWTKETVVSGVCRSSGCSHFDRAFIKKHLIDLNEVKIKMHLSVRSFLDIPQ